MKNGISRFWDRFLNVLYPPKCPGCGELLEISPEPLPLCPVCRAKWENEKNGQCQRCRRSIRECRCHPVYNKSRTCDSYRSAAYYTDKSVAKGIVLAMKYGASEELYKLAAREIELLIFRSIDLREDDLVIVYPPRGKKSVKKYGFDHTEKIAGYVNEHYGIPVCPAVLHKGGTEQKKLNYGQRGENAVNSFEITENARQLRGKRVILIDDVVTTGATTVAVAALCKAAGAVSVHCFTLAATP